MAICSVYKRALLGCFEVAGDAGDISDSDLKSLPYSQNRAIFDVIIATRGSYNGGNYSVFYFYTNF